MTDAQYAIMQAFNGRIYEQGTMDVQHEPLWDTVVFAAGANITAAASQFFTNVGGASGKTAAQTNMTQPGRLMAPEAFSIHGFRLRWSENILLADLYNVVNGFALNFVIGSKSYNSGPLWYYAAGGGVYASGLTQTNTSVLSNGIPGRESMNKVAIPIVIENQSNFYANFLGNQYTLTAAGSGGTGAVFQLVLDGLHARGVQ